MKIIVLLKQVPDTWDERGLDLATGSLNRAASEAVIDEIDERALEIALRLQDSDAAEVVALTMGPSGATDVLRKSLATGADSAVHVLDPQLTAADAMMTAAVLAAAIRRCGFDLVIAGNESTDGRGGVLAAMVAEHLGTPHATFLDSVTVASGVVSGERGTEYGTEAVHAPLPAIISVTERSAEPRFANLRGIMRAKKKPLDTWSLADLGIEAGSVIAGRSVILSTTQRPARIAGRKIIDEGNAGVEIADFLAAGHLI